MTLAWLGGRKFRSARGRRKNRTASRATEQMRYVQFETTTVNNLTRTARRRRCDALYPKIRKETRDESKQGMMDRKRHRNEMRAKGGGSTFSKKEHVLLLLTKFRAKNKQRPHRMFPHQPTNPKSPPFMLTNKWNQPTLVPLGDSDILVLRYAAAPPSLHAA